MKNKTSDYIIIILSIYLFFSFLSHFVIFNDVFLSIFYEKKVKDFSLTNDRLLVSILYESDFVAYGNSQWDERAEVTVYSPIWLFPLMKSKVKTSIFLYNKDAFLISNFIKFIRGENVTENKTLQQKE